MTESPTISPRPDSRRRTILFVVVGILVLAAAGMASRVLLEEEAAAVASFPVQQGEFVITLELRDGEMEAVDAEQIVAPQVRGQLKITHLFPEGEIVEVGDLILEFDKAEFEQKVTEREQELEASRAELEKTLANQGVEIGRQEADIENKTAQLRLSELQMEKMRFESLVEREEARLRARQAELAVAQAQKKFEAQKVVDGAEKKNRELDVAQKERRLDRSKKDLESLSVNAERPGLVVYEKIWKGSRPEKIRVGDEPWGGATLITLPDLSTMQVQTFVNEVDVDRLEVGLVASIRLDAFPGPVFEGSITKIAALGREKEGDKNVKVFDVTIQIAEEDSRLKPGMTATCDVIIETIPPRPEPVTDEDAAPTVTEPAEGAIAELPLFVPIDAVFEKNGETLVYRIEKGAPVEQVVVLGKRNDDFVVVEEGLGANDRVTLLDPTTSLETVGGMADAGGDESASAGSTTE
ncbi:MAG: HlyD family efflux transporter periplasmic adaptor subunit [Gemmatimonadetes bacterium]|jgi:HlyD family secretion protein|nr:HlyD family efflux transporter periplasmic adaptor subunit [Gemmatimonadota bacterium]MBT7861686.1 HlyD family efflux transporter periplasmic adaptor subunit [Gemmatimonadota bacterium]